MTKSELLEMLSEVPDDTQILLDYDGNYEDICFVDSQVVITEENETFFILSPCYCPQENEQEIDIFGNEINPN